MLTLTKTGKARTMKRTTSNRFIGASKRSSAASPVKVSGPSRLYPLLVTGGFAHTQAEFHSILRIAEIAYGHRDRAMMRVAARSLLNAPLRQAQDAGMFYSGIIAKREGDPSAALIFESLIDSPDHRVRARSVQALGAIHFEAARFDEAARLHALALDSEDPFTRINALFQVSFIRSEQGDYKQSLAVLNDLWPMVGRLSKEHPHLPYLFHNHVACDLLELGRVEDARAHSAIAVASPIAEAYPEWRETAREIETASPQAILVVVPARPITRRPPPKVITSFQRVESSARRRSFKPTIGRAPVIRSIVERVATVAPIHAPPVFPM
jgi:hypothetical protein